MVNRHLQDVIMTKNSENKNIQNVCVCRVIIESTGRKRNFPSIHTDYVSKTNHLPKDIKN